MVVQFLGCAFATNTEVLPNTRFYRTSIDDKDDQSIQLAFAPCNEKGCKIIVQFIKGKKLQNELPLHWSASSQSAYEFNADRWYGAGDPLGKTAYPSWALGASEQNSMVVSVQTVKLLPKTSGLMVHQTAGFEHVRRHHEMFLIKDERLKSVWKQTENQGPGWSNVIAPSGAGEFIYIEGFQPGYEDSADNLTVSYFEWNGKEGRIKKKKYGKTPLFLVAVSPFENIKAAREFIYGNSECLASDYMVLENRNNVSSKFIIGAITADRGLADRQLQKLTRCVQGKRFEILDFKSMTRKDDLCQT